MSLKTLYDKYETAYYYHKERAKQLHKKGLYTASKIEEEKAKVYNEIACDLKSSIVYETIQAIKYYENTI